ncbi:hypothetical protein GA0115233_101022 [Streptomyces sp. DI166]|uniref:hypothetical protein n=1 Tax=Streptomyces sp. DI166 TaxID=1839783 RepID=UPI0007F40932|nr:hypothetical protein [Streptomyces sp. DI166]SBT89529.1 hypothetical protein GA0115233_101022 [Streptomyces sp. DI166]
MTNSTAPRRALTPPSPIPTVGVGAWIASAHTRPDSVHEAWNGEARIALIPLGRHFDAVRIPAEVAHLAFASHDQAVVERRLARHLRGGPVIHDPEGHRYYALVPPGTAQDWTAPGAECLGRDVYLGVPRPDLTEPDQVTRHSYWAVPVSRPGKLCRVRDVLVLATVGGCLADDEDEHEASA